MKYCLVSQVYFWRNIRDEIIRRVANSPVSVVTYRTAAAADTIFISTPSYTSRVLGCLSHMTRVFVPVINTSISVCDTEYHFYSTTDGYA